MNILHIDHGFYRISRENARKIARIGTIRGKLPRPGWESIIATRDGTIYLARTTVHTRTVWTVRATDPDREIRGLALEDVLPPDFIREP